MIRLLLIEAISAEAERLQQILNRTAIPGTLLIDWQQPISIDLNNMAVKIFDVILVDLNLPDVQTLDAIIRIKPLLSGCPIVVLVKKDDNLISSQALQIGAQEFLLKDLINGADIFHSIQHAIDRKQIDLALERRARELEALYETFLAINAQIELTTLLQALVERAVKLMGLPIGGLYLVQPDNQSLTLVNLVNARKDYRGTVLKFGEGISGRVAQTGQPLAVSNYQEWEGRADIYADTEFQRVLAVPLRAGGKVIGVINLSDDHHIGEWSADEIRLASLFADQASIAVQNARLLDAERQKSAELRRNNIVIAALGQLTTRLSETLDSQQIMETLGNELERLGISVELSLFEGDPQPELVVRYHSAEHAQVYYLEMIVGQKIIGERVPPNIRSIANRLIDERNGAFHHDPILFLEVAYPKIATDALEAAFARINMTRGTPLLYLPLISKDQPLGMIAMWGADLREEDLLPFTIFANQVAAVIENARLYNRIERQATLDELTGLYNRRGFFLLAEQQLRMAHRTGSEMLLIFCDVDQLKQVNDSHGHKVGDQALVLTADALRATFRSADIVARISGDEFAVLAYASPGVSAASLMDRLKREVGRINFQSKQPFTLGLSAGFSLWTPQKPATLDELLAQADAQMYHVKRKKTTGELNPVNVSEQQ